MKILSAFLMVSVAFAGCTIEDLEHIEEAINEALGEQAKTYPPSNDEIKVHVVDVGQGDGIIIQFANATVIYDCGPAVGASEDHPMLDALRGMGHRPGDQLLALIASHGHLDHIGGCEEIVDAYTFENVYEIWYEGDDRPQSYQRFQEDIRQAEAAGATIHTFTPRTENPGGPTIGQGSEVDIPGDGYMEFLWPAAGSVDRWSEIAEWSLAVRFGVGNVQGCLQGDIEISQENAIIDTAGDVSCEFHVAGHHGSRHANSADWIEAMNPSVAVYSYGTNSYGHPTNDAICNHRAVGADIYATLQSGNIVVTLGPNGVLVDAEPFTQPCV